MRKKNQANQSHNFSKADQQFQLRNGYLATISFSWECKPRNMMRNTQSQLIEYEYNKWNIQNQLIRMNFNVYKQKESMELGNPVYLMNQFNNAMLGFNSLPPVERKQKHMDYNKIIRQLFPKHSLTSKLSYSLRQQFTQHQIYRNKYRTNKEHQLQRHLMIIDKLRIDSKVKNQSKF